MTGNYPYLTIGSLFSGYLGLDIGVRAGFPGAREVWVSDVDKGANKILAHRAPDVPNLGDVTRINWAEVEPVGSVIAPSPVILPSKRAALEFRVVRELPATDVFGPQGAHVAAVIERTRQLTADDAQRLVAARGPEWRAAWSAARSAVRVAARFAASEAAWDAAWCSWYDAREAAGDVVGDAAWDVAWDAAGDVVLALTVRDLVTREHYDTLTNSWRATIGPIHPDDY